jgi:hypothetical protein
MYLNDPQLIHRGKNKCLYASNLTCSRAVDRWDQDPRSKLVSG